MALSKKHRLKKGNDFQQLFSKGKGFYNSVCGIKILKNSKSVSRFAVVVGTKVSKRAVIRNRLRRQINSVIQSNIQSIKNGFDVILFVGKDAVAEDFNGIKDITLSGFKKVGIL